MSLYEADWQEKRTGERHRTLMTGRVYFRSGRSSLDCQVRNISLSGACLKGPGVTDLPDHFRLEIPARDRIYDCQIRWRLNDTIGIQFRSPDATSHRADVSAMERIAVLEYENKSLRQRIKELSERLAEFGVSTESL
jgi:hypothetical protein